MADPINVPTEVAKRMAQEKLAAQYRAILGKPPGPGEPETRSEAQIAVWADLEKAGYFTLPVFLPDRAGALCPIRGGIADGRRSLFLYIRSNVLFVSGVEAQPQQQ